MVRWHHGLFVARYLHCRQVEVACCGIVVGAAGGIIGGQVGSNYFQGRGEALYENYYR